MFGRLVKADARDKKFRIARRASQRVFRYWRDDAAFLDQGEQPHCVGYAWAHWLINYPLSQFIYPSGIYRVAQHLDEWDGQDYEGTSVRAGAKVLQELGFISEYRWAWSLEPLVDTLLEVGPVVIGVDWHADMMEPDRSGFLHASGAVDGGHAVLLNGVDTKARKLRVKNSWSRAWGNDGRAWLSFEDMARLLKRDGEVCLAIEARPAF